MIKRLKKEMGMSLGMVTKRENKKIAMSFVVLAKRVSVMIVIKRVNKIIALK